VSISLVLNGAPLSVSDIIAVARRGQMVELGGTALDRLTASRSVVEAAVQDGQAHYGINTGFGSLSRQRVSDQDLRSLQKNLVRSHSAGIGEPLAEEVVRAMLLLLAASLCRGHSGVRPAVVEQIIGMLNAGVLPVVPSIGSVGASGDLAPLAHAALVMIGEGEALVRGGTVPGSQALARAGLKPLELEAKEGLALINGTHLMAAQGALLCHDFDILFEAALLATAMSIDGCRATDAFLDPRVYQARNQPGPALAAAALLRLLEGSQIIPAHRVNDPRVQDPYSLRCAPTVLGAAGDAAGYVKLAVERELGGVTDNPLIFQDPPTVVSAGNFHGMPLAIPLDTLAIAVSHIAGIAERRIFFMLSATDPQNPTRAYLSPQPGLHSGLMIAQYTAAAACNEIVGLTMPASVANIPTSSGTEDYNSFGPRSAAKARRALDLARDVIAIELLCAAEAIEYQRPFRSGDLVERAHSTIRAAIPRLTADRPLAPDIAKMSALISGLVVN
jgi:histidine ammonia-lyase